jgi:hypothetical protein
MCMNLHLLTAIISELVRLESLNYVGLFGVKYLSSNLTTSDPKTGNRVRAINLAPAKGWAIVAWGPPGDEVKHKFIRDLNEGWVYHGLEKMEPVH